MKTYGWYFARLALIVGLVLLVRVGIAMAATKFFSGGTEVLEDVLSGVEQGVPIQDVVLGGGGDGAGDPGRADQPLHDDLSREGQVVMRDGELVVLVDASDPDNEVWLPLKGQPTTPAPWLLREGWGPTVGAVVGGVGLYWFGWAIGGLVFGFGREDQAG